MHEINYFINDKMRLLLIIFKHLVEIDGSKVCPLNQLEISKYLGCSKVKVNQLIKELYEQGYIDIPQKGRYSLTNASLNIIEKINLNIGELTC